MSDLAIELIRDATARVDRVIIELQGAIIGASTALGAVDPMGIVAALDDALDQAVIAKHRLGNAR
jgi:hypothetical protein